MDPSGVQTKLIYAAILIFLGGLFSTLKPAVGLLVLGIAIFLVVFAIIDIKTAEDPKESDKEKKGES
jgi:hypothetical protein